MMRRESGSVRSRFSAEVIWSTCSPDGVGQDRHCTPYTGPRSPVSLAHSSQIVTPCSCSQLTLESPRKIHSSSYTTDFRCTFLVVISGKPADRSYRIWWPNRLRVPVPVRSALGVPRSSTRRSRSSYGVAIGTPFTLRPKPGSRTDGMPNITDTITTPDGTCTVRLFTPEGDGPWPGVVMFPDAGGVRETFYQMAAKLAGYGYAVLLPDVYYRNGDWAPFDMISVFGDENERNRLFSMIGSLTPDKITGDATAFFDFLAARPEVAGERFGVCGYCMGG